MPRLIWVGDDGRRYPFAPQPWWATRVRDSMTLRGEARTPQYDDRVPTSRSLWLGWGKDEYLERWWMRRRDWASKATHYYHAAIAPNFSVYGNHPRMEHLINMRRSLLAARLLEEAGIPSIPNVYGFRHEDLDRWCQWMHDYRPRAAAHNLSTFRGSRSWDDHYPKLLYLSRHSPPGMRWVFGGVRSRERLSALSDLFGRSFALVTPAPIMLGRLGRILTADGREQPVNALPGETAEQVGDTIRSWLDIG